MKYSKIIKEIEEIAPLDLGANWDNTGVQINTGNDNISSIMCCLEINRDIVDEAVCKGVDLIVSHHPLLFNPVKSLDVDQIIGEYVIKLVLNGISVYSSHIPFDNSLVGNNYYLANLLNLKDIKSPRDDGTDAIGLIGDLEKDISFNSLVDKIADVLDMDKGYFQIGGDPEETIRRIALCTGAGGDILDEALEYGADLILTGDIKYHQAMSIRANGLAFIDAGHYGTEKIFSENMVKLLEERLGEEVIVFEAESKINPYILK